MTPPPSDSLVILEPDVSATRQRFGAKFGINQVMENVVFVSRISESSLYRPLLAVSPLSLPTWSVAQAAGWYFHI